MNPMRSLASARSGSPGARLASLSLVSAQRGWTQMPTGDELIELARAVALTGDRSAFAVLFKHFAPRVKAYLVRSGLPVERAEELAQETMVNVWRKAASFDPERAQLSTWIFTIARNLRVDHLRRQHDRGTADMGVESIDDDADVLAQMVHDAAPLDEQLGAARREAAVRRALQQLAPEQLQVLWLSFYDEQSHARIAQDLNVPLGTVKSRIRLAVNHLRRLLDGTEP
ncbi:MAG: sigma-70 family RNA polymerase sigma factor [Burkholderiaceae bacterium]|nr:sigma-70 family RNA polymerase sigma factor [Burkholderiaceae bacterium]